MMSKIIKNITVFFLWLAVAAICGHLIIPHDHHLVESLTSKDESCPVSNSKTGHHTGFPIHCHVFNDLTSEKTTTIVLKRNVQFDDLSLSNFHVALVFELQISLFSIFYARESFPDPYLLELSLLRAPPWLS